MRRRLLWQCLNVFLIGVAMSLWGGSPANAQTRGGSVKQSPRQQFQGSWQNRPTVSPYLSLINNGSNGSGSNDGSDLSYFNIVRPRQQAQKAVRRLNSELKDVTSNLAAEQNAITELSQKAPLSNADGISSGRLPPSGHRTSFNNLENYYPGLGAQR